MALNFPNSPSLNDTHTHNGLTWVWNGSVWEMQGSGGASVTVSDNAPSSPTHGDMWWESDTGDLKIYYDESETGAGSGAFWVSANGADSMVGISTTAPTNPQTGDLWWDSDVAALYMYYNDGNSSQWVSAASGATGAQGAAGAAGAQGATGAQGAAGAAGAQGDAGATGAQGATGSFNTNTNATIADLTVTGDASIAGALTYEDVTNVDAIGIVTARAGVKVPDNQKVFLGTGDDLQIYHDGTDTWIDNDEGDLYLRNTGDDIIIRAADDVLIQTQASEGAIIARGDGQVELYHNNSKKFETTTTGATVTGTLVSDSVTSELDLSAISSSISDTAVDVFVYDTRKDSDGGAWRKRTQHTSWYNETLNTSTRGSRKEFPAVAVIVVETGQVTIYDGDDPDLPMWMIFNQSTTGLGAMVGYTSFTIGCVTMLNGLLMVGLDATNQGNVDGLRLINFISEHFSWKADSASRNSSQHWPIEDRNGGRNLGYNDENYIVNEVINDVAATVLPNSQIDDATGLPVPTIAVATRRGVSIIKDDGSVADLEHDAGTHETCRNIAFSEDKTKVLFTSDYNDDNGLRRRVIVEDIPSADTTYTVIQNDSYQTITGGYDNGRPRILGGNTSSTGINEVLPQAIASGEGITFLDNELDDILNSKVAYVTTSYNTGWMHRDIKGAFLSDTDTTNVSPSSNLVSNGDFADTNLSNYFTLVNSDSNGGAEANSAPYVNGSNQVVMGNSAQLKTSFNLVAGRVYRISYDCVNKSITQQRLGIYVPSGGSLNFDDSIAAGATNTYYYTATSTGSTLIEWRSRGAGWGTYDNFTIIESTELDRSVNNKGLEVYGTITKSAVATGADLVAYSGFSASNHLAQPYNSDLNPGSGTYSVVAWFKTESNNSGEGAITGLGNGDSDEVMIIYVASSYGIYFDYGTSTEYVYLSNSSDRSLVRDGKWHQVVCQVTAGQVGEIYIDGIKRSTAQNVAAPGTWSQWDTNYRLYVGCARGLGTLPFSGSISLVRYSLSKMSAEQIKKMYEDEKMLFQENAKATLYGSSDAVTALAYDEDTELLHVGTSSGRSDFQGLRRINNTTTAVTTAISASDELIAEQ